MAKQEGLIFIYHANDLVGQAEVIRIPPLFNGMLFFILPSEAAAEFAPSVPELSHGENDDEINFEERKALNKRSTQCMLPSGLPSGGTMVCELLMNACKTDALKQS